MKDNLHRKGLVFGIVVLFIGMSGITLAGTLSIEKQIIQESSPSAYSAGGTSGISLITIEAVGETGLNNWFNNIGFTFSYESEDIAEIKYKVGYGPWQTYNEPFYVFDDGEEIWLEWYAVDHWGNQSDIDGPFIFNLDQTDPTIDLTYEVISGNPWQGWVIELTATATDVMSGMDRVEFYLNDELQSTVSGAGPTYQWSFTYFGDISIDMYATAFDNAGNSATDIIEEPCLYDVPSESVVEENSGVDEKSPSGTPTRGVFDPGYIIVVFDREMGEDGWIVSDASFPIFYESDTIAEVYYQIDDEGWMLYAEPIVIPDDGTHSFSWYIIDSEGYTSTPGSTTFKIDQTLPEINLTTEKLGSKKIKFIADVYDETSGIKMVKFLRNNYVDFTDYDFPYEWIWDYGLYDNTRVVKAKVYDNAGNMNSISIDVESISYNQQASNLLLLRFSEKFLLLERLYNVLGLYTE
jgi:hypothetical protein